MSALQRSYFAAVFTAECDTYVRAEWLPLQAAFITATLLAYFSAERATERPAFTNPIHSTNRAAIAPTAARTRVRC